MTVSAEVDERTLREIYLPAFERVVTTAQPWTVMCSYNRINGVVRVGGPVAAHGRAARRVGLRGPRRVGLGRRLAPRRGRGRRPRPRDAVVRRRRHARSSSTPCAPATLSEADVDRAVTRVLDARRPRAARAARGRHVRRRGAPRARPRGRGAPARCCSRTRAGSSRSIRSRAGPIAVIGEFARTPRYQGAGSSQVNPTQVDTALDALRDGARRAPRGRPSRPASPSRPTPPTRQLVDEAVRTAAAADVAVRLPRAAAVVRVRGLRPRAHGPAGPPGRAAARRRRRQPARRRGALQRLRGHRRALAGPRAGRARGLAARPGRRLGDRRPPARRRQPGRAGSPRPSRCATRTTRRSGPSRASTGACATARAC